MNFYLIIGLLFNFWAENPQLRIEVRGIEQFQGNIMVAVYDSRDKFLSGEVVTKDVFQVKDKVQVGSVRLPFGAYGIVVLHDVNSNGKLDKKFLGIPDEPVGFSNDAKIRFGPPSFENTLINFGTDNQLIKIELN